MFEEASEPCGGVKPVDAILKWVPTREKHKHTRTRGTTIYVASWNLFRGAVSCPLLKPNVCMTVPGTIQNIHLLNKSCGCLTKACKSTLCHLNLFEFGISFKICNLCLKLRSTGRDKVKRSQVAIAELFHWTRQVSVHSFT